MNNRLSFYSFSDDNYVRPWLGVMLSKEQYYLRYESSYLLELGQAMNYLVSCVASAAAQETLKYTVLSGKIILPLRIIDTKKLYFFTEIVGIRFYRL